MIMQTPIWSCKQLFDILWSHIKLSTKPFIGPRTASHPQLTSSASLLSRHAYLCLLCLWCRGMPSMFLDQEGRKEAEVVHWQGARRRLHSLPAVLEEGEQGDGPRKSVWKASDELEWARAGKGISNTLWKPCVGGRGLASLQSQACQASPPLFAGVVCLVVVCVVVLVACF